MVLFLSKAKLQVVICEKGTESITTKFGDIGRLTDMIDYLIHFQFQMYECVLV